MDSEEFKMHKGRHRRHWRRGRGHGRFFHPHYFPVYTYSYPRYVQPSQEYNDCVYAVGACTEQIKEKIGEYGVQHPEEVCKKGDIQEYVQKELPKECRPKETENYNSNALYKGSGMGVL